MLNNFLFRLNQSNSLRKQYVYPVAESLHSQTAAPYDPPENHPQTENHASKISLLD